MPANPPDNAPRVSVVVVNWNGADILAECLDSLAAQALPSGTVEIIVVENASTDGSASLLAESYPQIRVVPLPRNVGFAGGANAGIAEAHADVVVLLNNDARAEAGFLAALLDTLLEDDGLGAATARIHLAGGYTRSDVPADLRGHDGGWWRRDPDGVALVNSTGNLLTRSGNGVDRDWLVPQRDLRRAAGDVAGFSGGAVALRRAALDDAGVFSPELFMYFEDSELSWRMRRRGWRIGYAPNAVATHRHAASSGVGSDLFVFHTTRNRLVVALRLLPAGSVASAWGRALISASRASVARTPSRRARWRAIRDAVRMAPASLRLRRAIENGARMPRATVARDLVRDPR